MKSLWNSFITITKLLWKIKLQCSTEHWADICWKFLYMNWLWLTVNFWWVFGKNNESCTFLMVTSSILDIVNPNGSLWENNYVTFSKFWWWNALLIHRENRLSQNLTQWRVRSNQPLTIKKIRIEFEKVAAILQHQMVQAMKAHANLLLCSGRYSVY